MIEIDLSDKVVAVTGAAGGLGGGIAGRLAAAGASLVLQYRSTPPVEDDTSHEFVQLDLLADDAPRALIAAAIDRFGRIDAVINNAAVQDQVTLLDMTDAEWSVTIDTNLTACHRLTQAFARHAIERGGGGSVVHIGSIEGTQPATGHAHYGVTKAALIMHAKAAAVELGPHDIRINTISPGLIDRDGLAESWPEGVDRWLDAAPLGRLGDASDIGDACVFLCSRLARWITGTNLVVDGGVSARSTW